MRTLRAALVAPLLALLTIPASAEEDKKVNAFFSGGLASPLAPDIFTESWKEGWGFGGGVSYRINSGFAFEGRVEYDSVPFDRAGFGGFELEGGDVSILSFVGDLKFAIAGDETKISPYVLAGGGLGRISTGTMTIIFVEGSEYDLLFDQRYFDPRFFLEPIEGESEVAPLITFGGGVDIRASDRMTIFVEGRYQRLFTTDEPTDHGTIRGGLRIRF